MTNIKKLNKLKQEIAKEKWEDDEEFAEYLATEFKIVKYTLEQKISLVKANERFNGGNYWVEQFLEVNGLN